MKDGLRETRLPRHAAVQSLSTYTVSMCNKLALEASQLCHLIASHSVLAVLTPYQSAYDEDHIMHLLCNNVPVFAPLVSFICCQYVCSICLRFFSRESWQSQASDIDLDG